jgi:hypothetical protein
MSFAALLTLTAWGGKDVTDQQRNEWSTQNMVSEETPQTILIGADDDAVIDASNR